MSVFVTVVDKGGGYLLEEKKFASIEDALSYVSRNYLIEADAPWRWTGYFAVREGEITWLKMNRLATGECLREGVSEIDILSERGFLEKHTFSALPKN